MKEVRSDEARRTFRDLLNEVEYAGEHVAILRYKEPVAVVVSKEWYEEAKDALEQVRKSREEQEQ